MNRTTKARLERVERTASPTRSLDATTCYYNVKACASYTGYLEFLELVEPDAPDHITGTRRWRWKHADAPKLATELASRENLPQQRRSMSFLNEFSNEELEFCQELLAIADPAPPAVISTWQRYAAWAAFGPPADRPEPSLAEG
ncbi:MAG TPA: hypothetical protein VGV41_12465 [Pseudolabrys sp.]|uniref:hypothetical protein n=1 Tax=Pseudolabrys sp. TaxID=1960880 RepID=UPI002DDD538B|nr:hypothetical protein [Pseudolabrys sp.]HEV2629444.1 hypothetical protein [Pseudolabrys sp.]